MKQIQFLVVLISFLNLSIASAATFYKCRSNYAGLATGETENIARAKTALSCMATYSLPTVCTYAAAKCETYEANIAFNAGWSCQINNYINLFQADGADEETALKNVITKCKNGSYEGIKNMCGNLYAPNCIDLSK